MTEETKALTKLIKQLRDIPRREKMTKDQEYWFMKGYVTSTRIARMAEMMNKYTGDQLVELDQSEKVIIPSRKF